MGTKFAPVYATLTIGYFEEKLLNIIEKDYDAEFSHFFKTYWNDFWAIASFPGLNPKKN